MYTHTNNNKYKIIFRRMMPIIVDLKSNSHVIGTQPLGETIPKSSLVGTESQEFKYPIKQPILPDVGLCPYNVSINTPSSESRHPKSFTLCHFTRPLPFSPSAGGPFRCVDHRLDTIDRYPIPWKACPQKLVVREGGTRV